MSLSSRIVIRTMRLIWKRFLGLGLLLRTTKWWRARYLKHLGQKNLSISLSSRGCSISVTMVPKFALLSRIFSMMIFWMIRRMFEQLNLRGSLGSVGILAKILWLRSLHKHRQQIFLAPILRWRIWSFRSNSPDPRKFSLAPLTIPNFCSQFASSIMLLKRYPWN